MGSQQWQWEESQWKSNNDQIVYHCRVRTNRDDLPWQATRIYDIPSDGHQALVRKTGLSPYRIYDWARVTEHRENNGYQDIYVSIERIWFNRSEWEWKKDSQYSNRKKQGYRSRFSDELTGSLLQKLRGNYLRLADLSTIAKENLAVAVDLPQHEIDAWCQIEKVERKPDHFIIHVSILNAWLKAPRRDDWEWVAESSPTGDNSLKYYTCKGRAISSQLMIALNSPRSSRKQVSADGWRKLAEKTGLDVNEAERWGQDFSYTASPDGLKVRVGVPNVWICVDLLQGGNLWNRGVVNWGGTFGQAISYLGTWGKKEIHCWDIKDLIDTLIKYKGRIWGMVLYAHGMPIGQISESSEDSFNQATLITCVKKQDFKLAKLYLMQCYSGYQGNVSILWNELDKFIETRKSKEPEKYKYMNRSEFLGEYKKATIYYYQEIFKRLTDVEITDISINGEILSIKVRVNWKNEWSHYVVDQPNITYQGVNVLGVDIWPLQVFCNYISELFTTVQDKCKQIPWSSWLNSTNKN